MEPEFLDNLHGRYAATIHCSPTLVEASAGFPHYANPVRAMADFVEEVRTDVREIWPNPPELIFNTHEQHRFHASCNATGRIADTLISKCFEVWHHGEWRHEAARIPVTVCTNLDVLRDRGFPIPELNTREEDELVCQLHNLVYDTIKTGLGVSDLWPAVQVKRDDPQAWAADGWRRIGNHWDLLWVPPDRQHFPINKAVSDAETALTKRLESLFEDDPAEVADAEGGD